MSVAAAGTPPERPVAGTPPERPVAGTPPERPVAGTPPERPVALYVHFPFCLSICPYCDFVVAAGAAARGPTAQVARFVRALCREVALRAPDVDGVPLASVYLGGGTPSLMAPAQVEQLLQTVDEAFGMAGSAEVTLEVNPGPAERGDLAGFRTAGVNRLSIGAQSMNPDELRALGRRHSPKDVAATVAEARRAGFEDVSLDLLYDVPGQTLSSWATTLVEVLAMAPDHVSSYALTLDDPDAEGLTGPAGDHLPLRRGARGWRSRARAEQDEDRAAAMYLMAAERLSSAGLGWYEISNWARPGHESRHNLAYWNGVPWEAVGPGAHAFDGSLRRRWNAARLDAYADALEAGRLPPGGHEVVDEATAAADSMILQLRTSLGLPVAALADTACGGALEWGLEAGLLEVVEARLRLSPDGRLLGGELFSRLLPERASRAA
jgi:putative oxygen-independent coproporphyrinogen III oxidase